MTNFSQRTFCFAMIVCFPYFVDKKLFLLFAEKKFGEEQKIFSVSVPRMKKYPPFAWRFNGNLLLDYQDLQQNTYM
jgi:hypothetical protein